MLAFAGTTRTDSFNKKLARIAAKAAEASGAECTFLDLRDLRMSLYDGDLEAEKGIPENGRRFKELLKAHEGFLISAGEYNSSITGVLKNAMDWASRRKAGESEPACFKGKAAGLLSVIPELFALPRAHEAFDSGGPLKDERHRAKVQAVVEASVRLRRIGPENVR